MSNASQWLALRRKTRGRPMERRALGGTGIEVPAVGMGTWRTFDVRGESAEANAREVVDAAFGGRVDLYQVHNLVSWREHLPVLEGLRDSGVVSAVGATHYSQAYFKELRQVMETGRVGFVQIPYNPREREVEREILPLAAERGIGVVVMRPFAEGGLVRRSPSARDLEPLRQFGVMTWAQALIKWVLSDGRCHVTIPATSRPERMRENAAAGDPPWFGPEERRL